METVLKVEGMTCGHCKAAVMKAVEGVPGTNNIIVSLENKEVTFNTSNAETIEKVKEAIEDQGYDIV
ncbi:cation transporter [Bacillus sp. AFS055030]|uniref:cation transporter n=1 Tax=Bacillus sp. AFS055030 TaxID=2033507 RepID=UPI000BFC3ABA|nr:cation transporter [Bacillus sp. AFS055030]PGL71786.1 copper resistance protein CopZ [Bacillus sp. AFS055030]